MKSCMWRHATEQGWYQGSRQNTLCGLAHIRCHKVQKPMPLLCLSVRSDCMHMQKGASGYTQCGEGLRECMGRTCSLQHIPKLGTAPHCCAYGSCVPVQPLDGVLTIPGSRHGFHVIAPIASTLKGGGDLYFLEVLL